VAPEHFDPSPALAGLKDFQRRTVDHVDHRFYEQGARRFLVADEVGLGKTLVARGIVAKAIARLWESVERIDVLYICSNAEIARQNITRLNVSRDEDIALASRITLLPQTIKGLKSRKLNFISFTPGTSFEPRSRLGWSRERALIYIILRDPWSLGERLGPRKLMRGNSGLESFDWQVGDVESGDVDEDLEQAFLERLEAVESASRVRERFERLAHTIRRRDYLHEDESTERNDIVAELRRCMAEVCVKALEPDLIILDEFQRFRHLMDGESEAAQLVRDLFDFRRDDTEMARVLLLSATPYKMYTQAHEDADDHYRDFLRTLDYLFDDTAKSASVGALLTEFRREMLRLGNSGAPDRLVELKTQLETLLRQVMVRTERLASDATRNGMLTSPACPELELRTGDLVGYVANARLARTLADQGAIRSASTTLEHWKSSPYLLNFMDGYQLKRAFVEELEAAPSTEGLVSGDGVLPFEEIRTYRPVDSANARLRSLCSDTVGRGAWRLLWLPPALPYYAPAAPFDAPRVQGLTKRLVFSSWNVVPKAVAAMLSYEAERLMITAEEAEAVNTADARKHHDRRLLDFKAEQGRPSGMPVLGLMYPSLALAEAGDPLILAAGSVDVDDLLTRDEVLGRAQERVSELLRQLPLADRGDTPDERWYWAAPLLLDKLRAPESTDRLWATDQLEARWRAAEDTGDSNWAAHVRLAGEVVGGAHILGALPHDLTEVLAKIAVAGPGVAALRAMARVIGGQDARHDVTARISAASVGWAFRTLFNVPEVTALVRSMHGGEAFWRQVLDYCASGNLQAVLDEYVHGLMESEALTESEPPHAADALARVLRQSIGFRTTGVDVDEIPINGNAGIKRHQVRARFAVRYGTTQMDGTDDATHAKAVRAAFNSPFWPFVLASTSVGQEGLDFHPYCHAVVHWNLPSNPVDLEQREGRIHRYKGHAVRRNLAARHRASAHDAADPWAAMFEAARLARPGGESDLVPYWLYPGDATIERYVPALPLSRDTERLDLLLRSLTLYRMAFGQPRQDDLLEYLQRTVPPEHVAELVSSLRIELAPAITQRASG